MQNTKSGNRRTSRRLSRHFHLAIGVGIVTVSPHLLKAVTSVWTGTATVGIAGDGVTWEQAANWTTGGVAGIAPPNTAPGNDLFIGQGSTGTINMDGNRYANSLNFSNNFTLDAPGTSDVINDASGNVFFAGGSVTINSIFASSNGLTMNGSSDCILTLTNLNTYTGTTYIGPKETILISDDRNLGSQSPSPGPVTLASGYLQATSSVTTNRNFSLINEGQLAVDSGDVLTVNGQISGSSAELAAYGPGILDLTNLNNSFNSLYVFGGNVEFTDARQLGNTSGGILLTASTGLIIPASANATLAHNIEFSNRTAATDTFNIASGSTLTLTGGFTRDLNFNAPVQVIITGTPTGAGTLIANGNSSYTGGILLNATLSVASDSTLGTSGGSFNFGQYASAPNGNVPSTLITTQTFTANQTFYLGSLGAVFQPAASTALSIKGAVHGSGGLTVAGSGTLDVTQTTGSDFTGGIQLEGTLRFSDDSQLGDPSNGITFVPGYTNALEFSGNGSTGRAVQLAGSTSSTFIVDSSSNLILLTPLTGTGQSIIKSGTGALFLEGSNTYSGKTIVNAGTLNLGPLAVGVFADPAGSSDIILSGGYLALNGTSGVASQNYANSLAVNSSAGVSVNSSSTVTMGPLSLGAVTLQVSGVNGSSLKFGSTTLNGAATINIASNVSLGIYGVSGNSITLTGSGSLILTGPATLNALNVYGGSAIFNPTVKAALLTNSLAVGSRQQLDLTSDDLIVRGGSLSTIASTLSKGYGNGGWNGTGGIVSSSASADTQHLTALGYMLNKNAGNQPILSTFDGQNVTTTDVLVKYTYYGDADLSGVVDGSDYSRIDNGFLTQSTGWSNGDFNYDGVINGSDYTLIDNAFNMQGNAITSTVAVPDANPTATLATPTSVPEPFGFSLISISTLTLSRRRAGRQSHRR